MTGESRPRTIIDLPFRKELPRLIAAAAKLGNMTLRVIDDPVEALGLLRQQAIDQARVKYPGQAEGAYANLAATTWPDDRVREFVGPEAPHVVVETTFYGEQGLLDLQHTATHGDIGGRGQVRRVTSEICRSLLAA